MTLLLQGCCLHLFCHQLSLRMCFTCIPSFKGVHLKRAISSEEQWTRELLKHEKFHSGKLSTIEWVVMSNHLYIVFAVPFKKKIWIDFWIRIFAKKINTLFVKIFTLSVSIFWILMLCIVLFKYVFSDLLDIFIYYQTAQNAWKYFEFMIMILF